MALHINLEDLLSARRVESDRIECKEGWNPDATYRSICAFANDFDNTGGGYILIGVAKDHIGLLELCQTAILRKDLFEFLNLANHPANFKIYIKPLLSSNWLAMTIPSKPTSPKQQYLTTKPITPGPSANLHTIQ